MLVFEKCIECLRRWAPILVSVLKSAVPVHRICFSSWRAGLCPACAVIPFTSFRSESLQPVQLSWGAMLQNAGNHPDFWIREWRLAPSECASYNPCTGCMDYKRRISMVQVALLESRFRGDSLHSGAWCLRLAAQAAGIRPWKRRA